MQCLTANRPVGVIQPRRRCRSEMGEIFVDMAGVHLLKQADGAGVAEQVWPTNQAAQVVTFRW